MTSVNDVIQALALVGGIPPVAGRLGRPRPCPESVLGDKVYDSKAVRREAAHHRIMPVISRTGAPNIHGLGNLRCGYSTRCQFVHLASNSTAHRGSCLTVAHVHP